MAAGRLIVSYPCISLAVWNFILQQLLVCKSLDTCQAIFLYRKIPFTEYMFAACNLSYNHCVLDFAFLQFLLSGVMGKYSQWQRFGLGVFSYGH